MTLNKIGPILWILLLAILVIIVLGIAIYYFVSNGPTPNTQGLESRTQIIPETEDKDSTPKPSPSAEIIDSFPLPPPLPID